MSSFSRDRLKTMDALFRVRDVEERQAGARLRAKRMEILKLRTELESLRERRNAVLMRHGGEVLRERLLLDALFKLSLDRSRQIDALSLQSAVLLGDWRQAKTRKDAAEDLRQRRHRERELVATRREDQATAMLAAARSQREKTLHEEEPCEEL